MTRRLSPRRSAATATWPGSSFGAGPYAVEWNGSIAGVSAQQWLLAGFARGVSPAIVVAYADGTGDAPVVGGTAGSAFPATSLAVNTSSLGTQPNPTPGNVALAALGNPTGINVWVTGAGGSLTSFVTGGTSGVTVFTDAKVRFVNGNLVLASGSSTHGALSVFSSTTGANLSNAFTLLNVPTWILKSNQTQLLAIPANSGNPLVYSTADGLTWTTTALSVLGSTEVPLDVAWSSNKALWLLATSLHKFYTSPDGVTWTLVGTLTSLSAAITSVAASGSYWMAATYTASGTFPTNLLFSPDGTSWYASQTFLFPGQAGPPVLAGSPTQMAVITAVPTSVDNQTLLYRFSVEAGLPGVVLT